MWGRLFVGMLVSADTYPKGEMMAASSKGKARSEGNGGTTGEGEFRTGAAAGTMIVSGPAIGQKGLVYAEVDGMAIFEGDIVLGTIDEVRAAEAGDAGLPVDSVFVTGQQFRWPNARVPFEIDPAMPNQQRITDAIAHWEQNTPIRFVQRTAANAGQHPNFVHFFQGGGCSSQVGMRGGRQDISLAGGCSTGNAIHEIGHAVGLWHEQSREDRDTFVRIVFQNIDPNAQHNFAQHISDGDDHGPYDYGSLMHYPPTAFTTNGQATVVALQPLPPGVVMGQRNGLSAGDIAAVRAMYPTPPVTIKELVADPGGGVTIKEFITDPGVTRKELIKEPIKETAKELIKDTIKDLNFDPTRKEATGDVTIVEVTRPGPGPLINPVQPFIMGTSTRFGDAQQQQDLGSVAQELLQNLAAVIAMMQQQQAEITQAYAQAAQVLDALSRGTAQ